MIKLKKSKNNWGKRLASGSLAASLILTSMMPTNVLATTKREELKDMFNELVNSEKLSLESNSLQLELEENPIREGLDLKSTDVQSVIIQFKSPSKIESRVLKGDASLYDVKNEIEKEHHKFGEFLSNMSKERGNSYSIKHSYYNTFNGVALDIKGTDIEELLESGVVKAVWKDEVARTEPKDISKLKLDESNNNSRMVSSTPLIEVDKLRNEGLDGEGIKVGVIDTGIDYNHPDLKDNYKGGYDFVDNDNDPMETTREDWIKSGADEYYEESPYYTSHGTHVSGTVAATGKNTDSEFAVTGIAPKADIYGYRVLGPYGFGDSSDILAGIEKSVEDGMDVINLSLGIGVTDPLYPTSVACNNAALEGTIPIVANGNAGPEFSTLGSPGASPLAISVGASSTYINIETFDIKFSTAQNLNTEVDNDVVNESEESNTDNTININGRLLGKTYKPLDIFTGKEFEIVYGGLGNSYELEGLDVSGKVLLIDRGEISFLEKLTNAKNAGAEVVIIVNNKPDEDFDIYLGETLDLVPSIGIKDKDGQAIKEAMGVNGEALEVGAEAVFNVELNVNGSTTTEGDLLGDFSSRGPVSDETIKPDVVAPGVSIFSTYPEFINSPDDGIDYSIAYSRISGTSMAAPHVAGVVALMLQNNKDLTAAEVKVALMNTCDDLKKDYPINAMGAGRINAYNAVHANVSVSVLDKTYSLNDNEEKVEIDYVTGSLSYDRLRKGDKDISKILPVNVENNGTSEKKFNISVRYLGKDELAQDALKNGVKVNVPNSITLKAGESVKFDSELSIPANAEEGRYEGYVILTNSEDSSEEYSLPFSGTYVSPGISSIELSRPAISNDLEMVHFAKLSGSTATVKVSAPLESLELYVKDYETKEVIGFLGIVDFSQVPGGSSKTFYAVDSRASYFPMKDGEIIENVKSSLKDGKYIIEFIGNDLETNDQYRIEKNILIDNEDAKMTFDKEAGVYVVSDDMYTTEEYLGSSYEAFWVHGKVTDNSIEPLKEMGYKTDASDIIISGFLNGMPLLSLEVAENGDFKFGIEKDDLDNGQVYEFSPMPIDVATSQNLLKQPRYFFVKEGVPYTSVTLNKDEMNLNDTVVTTITTNNLEAGSEFKMSLSYVDAFETSNIRINEELQKVLDENNYKASIKSSITKDSSITLDLTLSITDSEGNPVNISGTNKMVNVDLKLTDDSLSEFYREYIECSYIEVADKDGNIANMSYTSTYEGVDIIPTTSSLFVAQLGQGFGEALSSENYTKDLDKYIWVEDSKGNKYELEYDHNMQTYLVTGLPVSEDEYRVYTALPGHFNKVAKFVPSRVIEGEVVSKVYYLLGSEFYRFIGAGDVNKDGWIDILDALEVQKFYGKEVDYAENPVDFNFDGIVNEYDMDYIVANFGQYNEQVAEGQPVLEFEGNTLDTILNDTGYNSNESLKEISIDKADLTLEVGNSDKLTATILPEGCKAEVKWTSSCEDIVTVDENGVVTAVNSGSALVKAIANRGKATAYCWVTVTKDGEVIAVNDISSKVERYELTVGQEQELDYTINPEDAVVESIEFVSGSDSIATVVDGKVVAKSAGTTIITANVNSGLAKVTWEITVKEDSDNSGGEDDDKDNKPQDPVDPDDGDKDNKPQEPVNPDDSENDKDNEDNKDDSKEDKPNNQIPVTGGGVTMPLLTAAIGMICAGIKMRKKK